MLVRLILQICIFRLTAAWNHVEHLIIADVAKMHLERNEQGERVLQHVNNVLNEVMDVVPRPATLEDVPAPIVSADLVSESVWLDKVKPLFTWHLQTRFFSLQTGRLNTTAQGLADVAQKDMPVGVWAFNTAFTMLKGVSIEAEQSNWTHPFALRVLIHVLSDLHQPLHVITTTDGYCWWNGWQGSESTKGLCDTIITDPFVGAGDGGGNCRGVSYPAKDMFKTSTSESRLKSCTGESGSSSIPCVTKLHSYWDSAGRLYQEYMNESTEEPLPDHRRRAFAEKLALECTDSIESGDEDPNQWVEENVHHFDDVYPADIRDAYRSSPSGLVAIPAEYEEHVRRVAKLRMCLAGKRLARVLSKCFEKQSGFQFLAVLDKSETSAPDSHDWHILLVVLALVLAVVPASILAVGRRFARRTTFCSDGPAQGRMDMQMTPLAARNVSATP